jgi:anti-sigma regulatory factor (Ser/Thr protein kinase)
MRELSLHILDIVTNSIEARASRIIIAIEESAGKNLFRITIRDNGRGMSAEMVQKAIDPFVTSRITRSVGMGLALFKQAARQSEGDLKISSSPGNGTTVIAEFKKNNINRAPLGNMADTIVNLIIGSTDVHFCYMHKTDHGKMIFDSYWLLARMAEQECSLYELIEPAKEFINKKLLEIESKG